MNHATQKSFNEKFEALKHSVQLSATQKEDMRASLSAYTDLHTVTNTSASRSYAHLSVSSFSRIFFSRAFVSALLILVIVVGSGAGVSYAAENSLPGQPLYAVKVDVAEPVEGALITSPTAQAEWQNTLAERRLNEATTLAAENDLATSTQTYLEQQATIHVDQSEQDSTKLAASGNTDAALAVRSDLEARLSAHSQLLGLLDSRLQADGDASTSDEVGLLLQKVDQDQSMVSSSREASEVALAGGASTETVTTETSMASSTVSVTVMQASSTPTNSAGVAFVAAQDNALHTEERTLFTEDAAKLGLLPASTTTASSTVGRNYHTNGPTASSTSAVSTSTLSNNSNVPASSTDASDTSATDLKLRL